MLPKFFRQLHVLNRIPRRSRSQLELYRRPIMSIQIQVPTVRSLDELELQNDRHSKRPRLEDEEIEGNTSISSGNKTKMQVKSKKKKKKDPPLPDPCSPADVLYHEIKGLIGEDVVNEVTREGKAFESPYNGGEEIVVKIEVIGSGGSGIALSPSTRKWAIVVPYALPGETVRIGLPKRQKPERMHSYANFLELIEPNSKMRDDDRVRCKYFRSCGGCQYQMLSSETQCELKRDVIVRAYDIYSKLPLSSIPTIESTIESPLVYNYRTKITPHFERPPKSIKPYDVKAYPEWLRIGFNRVNERHTLDIEECPIATSVLNEKYKSDRMDIAKNIFSYKKGVSLLYRESLDTTFDPKEMTSRTSNDKEFLEAITKHVCISDQNSLAREKVGDYLFEYTAGGFFQNNNSVLPLLVGYVRELVQSERSEAERLTHLVDAYCGAGLFAISLSAEFTKVVGIELSQSSILSARKNAERNGISGDKISFLSGDASAIFSTVADFPSRRTAVIIDPPRKGCDDAFLAQLVEFRPMLVVYVSCNVHTQARDVGSMVRMTEGDGEGRRYRVERIRGFDLFPQTAHVESVAMLRLY